VSLRLHADVPVGTGLSGGLDSSSIVCTANQLLRAQDAHAVQNTFSACSELKQYDERHHIDRVVEHTGVRAHYTYPAIDDFFRTLPTLLWHHDEPFEGTSVFAEWCVYRLTATTSVKVTLDGHGADELLAGYHTFFGHSFAHKFWRGRWLKLSSELRAAQARHGHGARFLLSSIASLGPLGRLMYGLRRRTGHPIAQAQWMETAALGVDDYDLYDELGGKQLSVNDFSVSQLLATSLPFQLRTCDRDSMAHSIESRAPFLDYRLVEFMLGCPDEFKLADGTTKRLLRTAMRNVLPTATAQRQDKMGFVTPEEFWVRQGAAARFKTLVDAAANRASGILNGHARERALRIIDGQEPFSPFVVRLVLFANWLDVFKVAVR
jgi:asparagine synthase (glutamine-hydrolysing)